MIDGELRVRPPPPAAESPAATVPPPRVLLTRADLATELEGHAFTIGPQRIVFAPGGRLYGTLREDVDVGVWTIRPEGQVCRTWNTWDNGRSRCYLIYRAGETFEWELTDRFARFVARRAPAGSGQ